MKAFILFAASFVNGIMIIEKRIHPLWHDFQALPKSTKAKIREETGQDGLIGKYHWIFSSERGEISCMHVWEPRAKKYVYQLHCMYGNLFVNQLRFDTLEEAQSIARKLLSFATEMLSKAT